jgi:purine-binding chemotaxis protein CheW
VKGDCLFFQPKQKLYFCQTLQRTYHGGTVALDLNTAEDAIQLIGFYIGQKLYGADILSIQEILRSPAIASSEDCPQFLEGAIEVRGESIPLVNMKRRLSGVTDGSEALGQWALVASAGEKKAAYAVEAVTRILKLSKSDILPAPDLILSGMHSQYIRGVYNSEFGLLIVLDLDRILSADEIKTLGKWTPNP